ncbi:MAG: class I SAM-dependent methyltransferase [Hyphomicrobiaceae bacterium]
MTGFSPEWLALREAADHRARDGMLSMALASALQSRPHVAVVDIGCGTGSNIRATYAALGAEQDWTLVDYDPKLLTSARAALSAWADSAVIDGDALMLKKSGKSLRVKFRQADLNADLDAALGPKAELITASALFDLCSVPFIERFAKATAARRAIFYTVLTYNGIQRWTPRHDLDQAMSDAFHAHQKTDKGFGVSAGPDAPAALAKSFAALGYTVQEGDSPWLLARSDQTLIDALVPGYAGAVRETTRIKSTDIDGWLKVERRGSEVGHTDTLALPPKV